MKLSKELKEKIDNYFKGKTAVKLLELFKEYGMQENHGKIDSYNLGNVNIGTINN